MPALGTSTRLLSLAAGPAGLICAFRFAGGQSDRLNWADVQHQAVHESQPGFTWVHVKTSDSRIHEWLRNGVRISEAARAFLTEHDTRPRLHVAEDGVYGLLVDLQMNAPGESGGKGALHFFLDGTRLITVRNAPIQSTDRLRESIERGQAFGDTMVLFAALVRCMAEGLADKVEALTDQVDDIEESVLSDRQSGDRIELSAVRRQLAELRRYINPERNVLSRLASLKQPWTSQAALDELAQAVESMNNIGLVLESLSDRAKLLQEEIASQMSEEMNRNLMLLSVLTAFLMPATLVSGVFGMNVAGLPGLKDGQAFWWVIGLMVVLGLVTLAALKRLRVW
jgi:zinc transporter